MDVFNDAISPGGVLHNVLKAMDETEQDMFLKSILRHHDPEVLCRLITCPYHDHSRTAATKEEEEEEPPPKSKFGPDGRVCVLWMTFSISRVSC